MIVDNAILRAWYARLPFPARYGEAFEALLGDSVTEVNEDFGDDPQANLLTALTKIPALEVEYRRLGIPEQIMLDTLEDIVRWTNVWYGMHGVVGVMETGWLVRHFEPRIFSLGRLQFCMGLTPWAIPEAGVAENDPVIEVHIPAGGAMRPADCRASIESARTFFSTYFPDYRYTAFTCHSWLLDRMLEQFLPPESNILQFQKLFIITRDDPADEMLKYLFRWDATRESLADFEPSSSLAAKIKPYALNGGVMHESLGWFK